MYGSSKPNIPNYFGNNQTGGNLWGNWLGGLSGLQHQQGLPDALLSQSNLNAAAQLAQSQLLNAFSLERAKDLLINGGSISETEHYFRKFKDRFLGYLQKITGRCDSFKDSLRIIEWEIERKLMK